MAYASRPVLVKWLPWHIICRITSNRVRITYGTDYAILYREEHKAIQIIIKQCIFDNTIFRLEPRCDLGFPILKVVQTRQFVAHTNTSRNPQCKN